MSTLVKVQRAKREYTGIEVKGTCNREEDRLLVFGNATDMVILSTMIEISSQTDGLIVW